jgi:hypothetical protein
MVSKYLGDHLIATVVTRLVASTAITEMTWLVACLADGLPVSWLFTALLLVNCERFVKLSALLSVKQFSNLLPIHCWQMLAVRDECGGPGG